VGDKLLTSSSGIPAHHLSEDSIPPALDASAETLVDVSVDPLMVEIVTVGDIACNSGTSSPYSQTYDGTSSIEPGSTIDDERRRLSFISFTDLIQSENRSATPGGPSSLSAVLSQTLQEDSKHINGIFGEIKQSLGDTIKLNK